MLRYRIQLKLTKLNYIQSRFIKSSWKGSTNWKLMRLAYSANTLKVETTKHLTNRGNTSKPEYS